MANAGHAATSVVHSGTTRGPKDYRFEHLTLRLVANDMRFSAGDAKPGITLPNLTLFRLDGQATSLDELIGSRPTLLIFGSVSCPMTFGSLPPLRRLYDEFGQDIRFVTLTVREAHPGEYLPQPQALPEKLANARLLSEESKVPWNVVVDDIDGSLHRALAEKPNSVYLLGPGRRVLFRALWAGDEAGLHQALTETRASGQPRRQESRAMLGPLAAGLGYIEPVLERAGHRAKRELLTAALPMAGMARLAASLRMLPIHRRGINPPAHAERRSFQRSRSWGLRCW